MARFLDWAHELPPEERQALLHFLMHRARHRADYLAWLDARGDPRAELLRIDAQLCAGQEDERSRERLRELLDQIDARWWNLVQSGSEIRACGLGPADQPVVRFAFPCPRSWQSLAPTDRPDVRACDHCEQPVYFCRDSAEVKRRARLGQCVAVGPDLASQSRSDATSGMVGRPDPDQSWGRRVFDE